MAPSSLYLACFFLSHIFCQMPSVKGRGRRKRRWLTSSRLMMRKTSRAPEMFLRRSLGRGKAQRRTPTAPRSISWRPLKAPLGQIPTEVRAATHGKSILCLWTGSLGTRSSMWKASMMKTWTRMRTTCTGAHLERSARAARSRQRSKFCVSFWGRVAGSFYSIGWN